MKSNGCRDVHQGWPTKCTNKKALVATTLISKAVHKQGALSTSSQASLHQWHCMSNKQFFHFVVTLN